MTPELMEELTKQQIDELVKQVDRDILEILHGANSSSNGRFVSSRELTYHSARGGQPEKNPNATI